MFKAGNMKKRLKFWLLLILVVSVAFGASSCNDTATSGTSSKYKTYTLKHYGVSFSFEYPVGYKTILSYIQDNPDAPIGVHFSWQETDPIFGVDIYSPKAEQVDPATAANTAGSHSPDEEIERTSIAIAGTTGELVAYNSYDYQNAHSINRGVYFDVNGVLWSISIYSSTANADKAENDFEHIISTFKVN
jgi:hypothetical protein